MSNKTAREIREAECLKQDIAFRQSLNKVRQTMLDKFVSGELQQELRASPYYNQTEAHRSIRELSPIQTENLKRLCQYIQKKVPVLNEDDFHFLALIQVCKVEWVRELEALEISGKSPESKMISIIKHFNVKYPIPRWLYEIMLPKRVITPVAGRAGRGHHNVYVQMPQVGSIPIFHYFANGGSVKKALKQKLIPSIMTAKMNHFFLTKSQIGMTIPEAVRYAQVMCLGGDRRIWKEICQSRLQNFQTLEEDPEMAMWTPSEDWWITVIDWICRQPMLNPEQIGPLIDFLVQKKTDDFTFQMAGRTAQNLITEMERWHENLSRVKLMTKTHYESSGFKSGFWNRKDQFGMDEVVRVVEILTAQELKAEGKALQHCVVSYAGMIEKGAVSIWSYRINDKRILTLEVYNSNRSVVQVRGKLNRLMTKSERHMVVSWCNLAGLTLSC